MSGMVHLQLVGAALVAAVRPDLGWHTGWRCLSMANARPILPHGVGKQHYVAVPKGFPCGAPDLYWRISGRRVQRS